MSLITLKVCGQECPLSPLLFHIILKVLDSATRQEKEKKVTQNRQKKIKLFLLCIYYYDDDYVENANESSK